MTHEGETLSVVVPVYGCAGCLDELHERLSRVLDDTDVDDWELLLLDDRSTDGSWERAQELAERDPRVRCLRFTRNFGQHAAISAGLQIARGTWTVVMDCDLQEPPEEIPRLLETARSGYHVVLTRREVRSHRPWRRFTGRIYFGLRRRLLKSDIEPETGSFSLLSRKAVDSYCTLNDRDRSYLMLVDWIGLSRITLVVKHRPRADGMGSSYTLRQLFKVAIDGVFFQTTALLRWIVTVGFLVALIAVILAFAVLYTNLAGSPLPGWTSIVTLTLILSSVIILSVGVSALYLGKVFEQVKGRPLYLIDEVKGQSRFDRASVVDPEAVADATPSRGAG